MMITRAVPGEFEQIRNFYDDVIDGFRGKEYRPLWKKDIYPSGEQLLALIGKGELFIRKEEGRIVSAMALNHDFNEGYGQTDWQINADGNEIFVIHILAVHPSCLHRGIASSMVGFAVDYAKSNGGRTVRLDVLKGNLPANKLYERAGFQKLNTITMYYPDTGNMDFELYELIL